MPLQPAGSASRGRLPSMSLNNRRTKVPRRCGGLHDGRGVWATLRQEGHWFNGSVLVLSSLQGNMEITVWAEGILCHVWPRMRQYFGHVGARNGHVAAGAGLGSGWLASANADTRKSPSPICVWIRPDSTSLCFDAAPTGSTKMLQLDRF